MSDCMYPNDECYTCPDREECIKAKLAEINKEVREELTRRYKDGIGN